MNRCAETLPSLKVGSDRCLAPTSLLSSHAWPHNLRNLIVLLVVVVCVRAGVGPVCERAGVHVPCCARSGQRTGFWELVLASHCGFWGLECTLAGLQSTHFSPLEKWSLFKTLKCTEYLQGGRMGQLDGTNQFFKKSLFESVKHLFYPKRIPD